MNIDRKQIINELSNHFSKGNDADFARFLGITPQTLSNWKSRNTFDITLIYTKCLGVNSEWLLTGKGEMFKTEQSSQTSSDCSEYKDKITELLEEISQLKDRIIQIREDQLAFKSPTPKKHKQGTT